MPTQPPSPGIAPRLYQLAAEALAREIASGALRDGAPLTQPGIARRFGISRAPARQALEALEAQGLLSRSVAGRYHVCSPPPLPATSPAPGPQRQPQRLAPRSSSDMLYPEVEMAVIARAALGDWRLNEAVLARHYGTSRTVAREIAARLHQRGIIRKDGSGRWIAPALSAASMHELYELRWVLEPLAMERAAPHLPACFLDRMAAELRAAKAPDAARDGALLDQLEQRLHVELLGHCGNVALMRAIAVPQAILVAHHYLYQWTLDLFGTEPFLDEHLEIVEHLRQGDIARAKAALVAHLRISRRRALLRIEAMQDMPAPAPLPWIARL